MSSSECVLFFTVDSYIFAFRRLRFSFYYVFFLISIVDLLDDDDEPAALASGQTFTIILISGLP